MNSNNDLMDPNWKPSPPDDFEIVYNEWYRKFNGVPNAVQVRLFCHEYIKKQECRLRMLTEALEWYRDANTSQRAADGDLARKVLEG